MAVVFDAFSSSAQGQGTLSWTHTPVGTPRGVLVAVVENAATDEVTSVTYGSLTLQEVAGSPNLHTTGEVGGVHVFFAGEAIPTGAQTVTVNVGAGAIDKRAGVWTVTADRDCSLADVDATINSDSLANPSVTLELAGRAAIALICFHSGQQQSTGITPLSGWTGQLENDFGAQQGAWYRGPVLTSADITAGWTQTAEDATMIAVAVTDHPDLATWPTLAVAYSHETTNTTSHVVTLPAYEIGDELFVYFSKDGSAAASAWPSGWTELFSDSRASPDARHEFRYRIADGTEGSTITITTAAAEESASVAGAVKGYLGVPETGALASGFGTSVNLASFDPSWGIEQTLWLACATADDTSTGTTTLSTYSTQYLDNRHADGTGGTDHILHAFCTRRYLAASDDPDVFIWSASVGSLARLVAIRPRPMFGRTFAVLQAVKRAAHY